MHFTVTSDAEPLFMCLLAVCVPPFVNCLRNSTSTFINWLACHLVIKLDEFLLIYCDTEPLLDICIAHIFSNSVTCLFIS